METVQKNVTLIEKKNKYKGSVVPKMRIKRLVRKSSQK